MGSLHTRQANLLKSAEETIKKLSQTEKTAGVVLWQYQDPTTGGEFYLTERLMTVRSPFTGKTFTTRPLKMTVSQVAKDLREEAMLPEGAGGMVNS